MLFLQHCDDPLTELEKLPKATQTGKDTFGCLVDGKAWVTEISTNVQAYYQTGTLSIVASLSNNIFFQDISIGILNNPNLTEGEYPLEDYPQLFGSLDDNTNGYNFLTTTTHTGKFTITHLDKTNYIISGTFQFEAYSTASAKVIKVTEGRFDIHYAS